MIAYAGRLAAFHLVSRAIARQPGTLGDAQRGLSDPRILSFARGLSIGALVGSAIAGLGIWNRLRRRAH